MPEQYPKISVVTACYNQGPFIEDCILSVIGQEYPNLEYIIMDGGSTDNTVDIIKKYESHISSWVSEKDGGLYDALHRGFQKTTGEIMGWINSDDLLMRKSLFTLADIFSNNPDIEWVQGHPCVADCFGRVVFQRPPRASKYSFYRKEYRDGIFIQQESTYWRRSLWEKSGSYISNEYLYAGDFELWMRFYEYSIQYTTAALIGAFRMRKEQLSEKNYYAYLGECDRVIDASLKKLPASEIDLLKRLNRKEKYGKLFSLLRKIGFRYSGKLPETLLNKVNYNRDLDKFVIA